jgi:glycosyltransferase 2 family protein
MKSIIQKIIPGILFGLLVVILVGVIGDIRQIGDAIRRFNWWMVPPVLAFTLIHLGLHLVKFKYYLAVIGVKDFPWKTALRIYVAGLPLAVTPGKAGEAVKGVWIKQACGVSVGKGVSVILADRITDGIAVLFLSTLGVIAYPRYWAAFLLVFGLLTGLIVLSQYRPAALRLLTWGEKIPLVGKFTGALREFYEGSYTLFKPVPMLYAIGIGMVSWLLMGLAFYLVLLGLGLPPSLPLFSLAVFVQSFSTMVGGISTLPGGLGAAEASITGMLVLLGSIDPTSAAAAALLIRFAILWFGVGIGLISWPFMRDLLSMEAPSDQSKSDPKISRLDH